MRLSILALAALWAAPLPAARIFQVTVNTSLINGTLGYLDFQFNNGGADADAGSASISLYTGGTLGMVSTSGDVSGTLPGTVTINNTAGLNDLFQGLTFESSIFFQVTIDGPVVNTFNPLATAGSTFAFSMYASDQATPLLTDDPGGFALTIDAGPLGVVAVNNLARSEVVRFVEVTVPEPSSGWLLLAGVALIAARVYRR